MTISKVDSKGLLRAFWELSEEIGLVILLKKLAKFY